MCLLNMILFLKSHPTLLMISYTLHNSDHNVSVEHDFFLRSSNLPPHPRPQYHGMVSPLPIRLGVLPGSPGTLPNIRGRDLTTDYAGCVAWVA